MSSRFFRPRLALGALAVAVPAAVAVAMSVPAATAAGVGNDFHQTNLVSNRMDQGAQLVDPGLVNPWGLALGPATPLWVADNGADLSTVYGIAPGGTAVAKAKLNVHFPEGAAPTGQVFNPTSGFVVNTKAGSGAALFIFSSESGHIYAWNPKADPIDANGNSSITQVPVHNSKTAVYKGLAIGNIGHSTFLFASNFHDNRVDVFDSRFHRVHVFSDFRDRALPPGYAPFGIQEINGFLYVTYALQDSAKHDDVAGPGHGFVDIWTNTGFLVRHLVIRDGLNSPWGLAVAPAGFGPFGGDLLVGNFGDGLIHAYGLFSGAPHGALLNEKHQPIQIDGLWGLLPGTATTGGTGTLLFSAGLNGEADGLVGSINPAM
jgi:uncharacterized protein (TIGR03118 family)